MAAPAYMKYYFTDVWNVERGLPQSSVVSLAQTRDGFLWVAFRQAGLARFDGARFVVFNAANTPELSQVEIRRLMADVQGRLWIVMAGGQLVRYEAGRFILESGLNLAPKESVGNVVLARANEVFISTTTDGLMHGRLRAGTNSLWEKIILPNAARRAYCRSSGDGRFWYLRTDGKLGCWRNGQIDPVREYPALNGADATVLTADPNGKVWVGTKKGLAVWSEDQFVDMTPTNGAPEFVVQDLIAGADDGQWVRTVNGLQKCIGRRWVTPAEPWTGLATTGDEMESAVMFVGRQGGVWVLRSQDQEGIWHITPEGIARHLTQSDGLPSGRVNCWFQDRDKNIWLGLEGGGLVRTRQEWLFQGSRDMAAIPVRTICQDGLGRFWFGGADGSLTRWQNHVSEKVALPEGLMLGSVVTLCPDSQDGVWVGTEKNGVWHLQNGNATRPFPEAAIDSVVSVMFTDSRKRLWLGGQSGLYCWSAGQLKHYGSADGFPDREYVLSIAEDAAGALWIGTGGGSLWQFQASRFTRFSLPESGHPFRFLTVLPDINNTVWVGTLGGGLLRWHDGKLARCTSENGLPSDTIPQLLKDWHGQLWAGSWAGIFSVPGTNLNAFFDGRLKSVSCRVFGLSEGLPSLECSAGFQPSACRSRTDNQFWFATMKGAVFVRPGDVPQESLSPATVVIEEMRVDAVTQKTGSDHPAPVLSPGSHYVEFRFTGVSMTAPERLRFQWRLEGLDSDWVEGGNERSASYSHLPPGKYTFHVRACYHDGAWKEADSNIRFTVPPYFWQAWWFKAVAGGSGLLVVFGAGLIAQRRRYRTRMQALERQQAIDRERMRIARDIHDQVGANLTKIGMQTDMLGSQLGDAAESQPLIQGVAETTREMLQSMDEIVWAINPRNDTLNRSINYLVHYTRDFLRSAEVSYHWDMPVDLPSLSLSTEVRHNLFMAFKEALNNAVKHGHPRSLRLVLALPPHQLKLVVEDDGCGFTPGTSPDGADGLENMRQRLKSVGGHCQVDSVPGHGTKVMFQLPL